MSEHLWAAVAILALAGWTTVLVLLSRSLLPMANALGVLNKVDSVIDDRIMRVVQRIREREDKRSVLQATQPQQKETSGAARVNPITELFGQGAIEPVGEQPDSSENLEIVN